MSNAARRLAGLRGRRQLASIGAEADGRVGLVDRGQRRVRTRQIVTQHREWLAAPIGHRNRHGVTLFLALGERSLRRAQRRVGGERRVAREHFLREGGRSCAQGRDSYGNRRKNRLGVSHRVLSHGITQEQVK